MPASIKTRRTWNRSDRINLDVGTARRARRIGVLGEKLAAAELAAHGFTKVKNLNIQERENYPGADIYAERDGRMFWISVKMRNKYANDGKPNPCYRLKTAERYYLAQAERHNPGTEAACVAISLVVSGNSSRAGEPARTYSCYFSTLRNLTGVNGIGMLDKHLSRYECLALNKPVPPDFDVSDLENIFERRSPAAGQVSRPAE